MRFLIKPSILFGFLFIVLIFCVLTNTYPVRAQVPTPDKPVYIYLFWGEGCPHCAKAKPFFESLPARYPDVILRTFEVYNNQENQQIFSRMADKYGMEQMAVPAIFIGPFSMLGYSESLNPDIEALITQCKQIEPVDPGEGIVVFPTAIPPTELVIQQPTATYSLSATPTPTIVPITPFSEPTLSVPTIVPIAPIIDPTSSAPIEKPRHTLDIPLFGTVDLDMQSTTLSTILIALVDGFNPCSLWVLSMLLALTLHTGSRLKILFIGLVFLTITAAIYVLFIVGLFSVLKIASYLGWIQFLVALVALSFAVVNIKDYFWYKEGISFTISDEKKTGIFQRMRAVMDASQSFLGLTSATVVLAAGVSMVEFSCTAGFPVIWVNLLNAQNVSGAVFIVLLLLYMIIYQLDEMAIFFSAIITLKASRMEEKHGRILKLACGMLMLTLSIVMLFNPALMNNLASSLIIFSISFFATISILFIHRVILPRIGIYIGSEFSN